MDYHYPVMLKEVEKYVALQIERNWWWVTMFDGTLWHAGHLIDLLTMYPDWISQYIATDADKRMFDVAKERIVNEVVQWKLTNVLNNNIEDKDWFVRIWDKIQLYNSSYIRLWEIAKDLWMGYDIVFLDLGVNLWHFKQHERGFSIKWEGELDMRYNTDAKVLNSEEAKMQEIEDWRLKNENSELTAADILNTYSEKQLIDMFVLNSEISLPTSTKIAEEVVRMRKNKPWQTSTELNKLTMKLNYSARVAAIVFQALRIEVNQEFQNIKLCIDICQNCMKDGGILMILSYHSGEDRIVKEVMKRMKEESIGEIVTKNAIPPSYHEVVKNKPSRSARLRVFRYTWKQGQ